MATTMPTTLDASRGRRPVATPTSTGTSTEVDEIGATTPITPVDSPW